MREGKQTDISLVTFPSFVTYFALRPLCASQQLREDDSLSLELPFPNNSEPETF